MDKTVAFRFSMYAGMDIGRDNGMTVDPGYRHEAPYPFSGTVKKVTFDSCWPTTRMRRSSTNRHITRASLSWRTADERSQESGRGC